MNNITIKFNNYCNSKLFVTIYDNNKVVYKKHINNNSLCLDLESNKAYRIEVNSCYGLLITSFYVGLSDIIYINLQPSFNRTLVAFRLTDYYYDNLPIEKGEMILWQR